MTSQPIQPPASSLPPLPNRRPRVLIVEDEPRLRELMLDVIPRMDFPATAARSAEEALRAMRADPREILLLDLHLPLMGGMEFFQLVRDSWPRTQVIVLTGFGDLEAARAAIRLEAVDFLSKPCPLRDLELALDRARKRVLATAPLGVPFAEEGAAAPPASPLTVGAPAVTLADGERQQILAALERHRGNRTAAAAELGISRRTLHYRLADYSRQGYDVK